MAGYPAHENAAKILENLREALAKAEGENKAKIESLIANLDPIKDNRTFMRTQKAEKMTAVALEDSEALKNNPSDAEKIVALDAVINELVERVRTMVIRMT
ncbi:hypothetical protein PTH_2633 [Pelotomaculum thermopropionicum SI]|uniref:Uncharacterized protein n=1 Tax=Pelotomaculum thermopropionicum (strain DSM 13744 / JCM 10971 / SI) TaxID=370438 RepID=A5CYW7_PELTS|nr:hypothetical protein PTH_2633 [Pelotomaculum thermopropionicum SI]